MNRFHLVACIFAAGCAAGVGSTVPTPLEPQPPIPLAQLVPALVADSASGRAALASPAFKQIVGLGGSAPLAEIEAAVHAGGAGALLPLLALRNIAPAKYDALSVAERAKVFAAALEKSTSQTAWGLPSPLAEPAAAAAALGPKAAGPFIPLLTNTNAAKILGSRTRAQAMREQDRVCDYATTIVSTMVGRAYAHDPDATKRDAAIRDLQQWLAANTTVWQ